MRQDSKLSALLLTAEFSSAEPDGLSRSINTGLGYPAISLAGAAMAALGLLMVLGVAWRPGLSRLWWYSRNVRAADGKSEGQLPMSLGNRNLRWLPAAHQPELSSWI